MSEDDREIDVDSDEEETSAVGGGGATSSQNSNSGSSSSKSNKRDKNGTPLDKRAHHNALERKRRDHIKDSFTGLRDAIPMMHGDKSSRAQILKKASDYIIYMKQKTHDHYCDIDDLKRQNGLLEEQIRALEKAKSQGTIYTSDIILANAGLNREPSSGFLSSQQDLSYEGSGSDTSEGSGSSSGVISATASTAVVAPTSGTTASSSRRVIQPGQSLLLNKDNVPPKKKMKI